MDEKLSFAQRGALMGASEERRALIEEESSLWMALCRNCGYEASIWDRGGVRYKAHGDKTQRMRCPDCGKRGLHEIYWAGRDEPARKARSRPAGRATDGEDAPPPVPPRAARAPAASAARGTSAGPSSEPAARLPAWLIVLLLMGVAFFVNEAFGVDLPVWLLILVGFGIAGSRRGARTPEVNQVTATVGGIGCLVMLAVALVGFILSRLLYQAQP